MQRTSNKLLRPLQFRKSAALMASVTPFFTEARNLIRSWPLAEKDRGIFFIFFYFFGGQERFRAGSEKCVFHLEVDLQMEHGGRRTSRFSFYLDH